MAGLTFPVLETGNVVDDRYEILRERVAGVYAARDTKDGTDVYLVALLPSESPEARALTTFQHPNFVGTRAIVDVEGTDWLVTDAPTGTTLEKRLEVVEKKATVDAVRSALRIADAVNALHDNGLRHGRLSPNAIVVSSEETERSPDRPLVMFGAPPPVGSPYRSPGRDPEEAGTTADDAWAVSALLFEMLTGKAPPPAGFADEEALLALGVDDEDLRKALFQGLRQDGERPDSLHDLRRTLARWFVRHAGDEDLDGMHSGPPPPLPGKRPEPSTEADAPTTVDIQEKRRVPMLAVIGVVAGLIAAWGLSQLGDEEEVADEAGSAPVPSAPASAAPDEIDLGEVAVTGDEEQATGNEMATCVTGHLPPGAFQAAPALGWICTETDPASGADRLEKTMLPGSDAAKAFKSMGAADQAAFAIVRQGCCTDAPPLASKKNGCGELGSELASTARLVLAGEDVSEEFAQTAEELSCGGQKALTEGEKQAFLDYARKTFAD